MKTGVGVGKGVTLPLIGVFWKARKCFVGRAGAEAVLGRWGGVFLGGGWQAGWPWKGGWFGIWPWGLLDSAPAISQVQI